MPTSTETDLCEGRLSAADRALIREAARRLTSLREVAAQQRACLDIEDAFNRDEGQVDLDTLARAQCW